jgi:gamma-glutamyltranspeptidase/glutathione hydrolase
VTVPGAVDAWAAILAAHGRFGLERALAPAISYAAEGFPVASRIAWDWSKMAVKLRADPGAARHFLFGGHAPAEGDVVKLAALAQTLRMIAAEGPTAFYQGRVAQDMVATISGRGSFLALDDFAQHRGDVVVPITSKYRDLDILELPPNTQGLTALVLLNILERFDLAALDPFGPDRFHLALESARLAYAVRDTHIADPIAMRASVQALLDKDFAANLAGRIDPARRVCLPNAPSPAATPSISRSSTATAWRFH